MTPITRLGNVATTIGLASTPEPLDEVVLAGLGEHRDDYDVEAIAAAARAVIEGALPDGVYLVGEDLMVEVAAWPDARHLPDGWQEEARDALDADTLAGIWACHETA